MVFQDYALFPWLSVRDNIGFGPAARGLRSGEVKATVDKFIELVGLQKFANAYPHQLSGGMKQRVAIARVLANDAELVLMDEPFGALDAMTRERLQDELLDIWQRTELTVVFVTHSVEEAIFLADRVVVMTPGPGRIESDNAARPAAPARRRQPRVQRHPPRAGRQAAQPSRQEGRGVAAIPSEPRTPVALTVRDTSPANAGRNEGEGWRTRSTRMRSRRSTGCCATT